MTAAREQETKQSEVPFRVVAASDFSPLGNRAVQEAMRLCSPYRAAELHVITVGAESPAGVILPGPEVRFAPVEEARQIVMAHAARLIDEFVAQGMPLPMDSVPVYTAVGMPSERIVALARAIDADLIVLGTHGREGVSRMLLGSVAEQVVRRAPCGVFVIRPRDFLQGQKLPEIQRPLEAGEHALLPFRVPPTFHYVHRLSREPDRLMPAI